MKNILLFALLLCAIVHANPAGNISDLTQITSWQPVSDGVWKATLYDAESELRYTDLAGEPSRLSAPPADMATALPFGDAGAFSCRGGSRVMLRFPTTPNERIFGFGLQLDGIDQTQKDLYLKVDHWSRGGGRTHAPVPFFISSRNYGVFINTARPIKVYSKIGVRKDAADRPPAIDRNPLPEDNEPEWKAQPLADAIEMSFYGNGVEVYVFTADSLLGVVEKYNLLSGGGAMPPLWGLGFTHRVPADFTDSQVREEVAAFREHSIPLDLVGLEPGWMSKSYPCTFEWNTRRFPDPKSFVSDLLDDGIRLNLWENPYISPVAKLYEPMLPLSGSHLVWNGIVPDYRLAAARKTLLDQHRTDHLDIGISGYKIDEVDGYDRWLWPDHATFPSGTPADAMRQTYGMQLQQMIYRDLYKAANTRTYSQVRAANGANSALPFVLYSDSYDHSEYITGISAASLSGLLWTPEVRQAKSSREWLNRVQTVCFSSLAHLNAWASSKKPWSYPEVTDAVREAIELRMRLLPYLYTAFAHYHLYGTPPFRAMILETESLPQTTVQKGQLDDTADPYAEDKIVQVTDQYMMGPDILVAPFYEKYSTSRTVRLPTGIWHDFYTGKIVDGSEITITAEQTKDRIPLFVKSGAIIPMLSESVQRTSEAYGHDLEIRVYGEGAAEFRLYEDDGLTFDYQQGELFWREITVDENDVISETIALSPRLYGVVSSVVRLPARE